jgi:hypothetical protein
VASARTNAEKSMTGMTNDGGVEVLWVASARRCTSVHGFGWRSVWSQSGLGPGVKLVGRDARQSERKADVDAAMAGVVRIVSAERTSGAMLRDLMIAIVAAGCDGDS